jgi:hypothetical protein
MEKFFTYDLLKRGDIQRVGKGGCAQMSAKQAAEYLKAAYPEEDWDWDLADIRFHSSEAAALKEERRAIDAYERAKGHLPPWNSIRGGGGRRVFARCKGITATLERCRNDALEGNYGFCGVHR